MAVWTRQAPHAMAQGTLTPGSAVAFERYCRFAAVEAQSDTVDPWLVRHINALELQFMLTPAGKPLFTPKPVEEPAPGALTRFRKA